MRHDVHFAVRDGALLISTEPERITLNVRPDGLRVVDVRDEPNGRSMLVLLDPPAGGGRVRNLVLVDSGGKVVWRGELPERSGPTDSFVSLELDLDGTVVAGTWSGYRVTLDPVTGRRLREDFTK